MKNTVLSFALIGLIASCNNKSFKGETPRKDKEQSKETIQLECEGESLPKEIPLTTGELGSVITIEGTFCKKSEGTQTLAPHVTFIVDFSNSMREVDPTVGDSCKRLDAAKALSDVLEAKFPKRFDELEFLFVRFNGTASLLSDDTISGTAFKEDYLNVDNFCGFERAATNYQVALELAKDAIERTSKEEKGLVQERHVFMLTDGAPTIAENGVECLVTPATPERDPNCGKVPSQELRQVVDNFNVLYLVDNENPENAVIAQPYLEEEIAANPDKVKFAESSEEAAQLIKEFEEPKIIDVDNVTAKANISSPEFREEVEATVKSSGEDIWKFSFDIEIPGKEATYKLKLIPLAEGEKFGLELDLDLKVELDSSK